MAEKRMFSIKIVDSDAFLEMPVTSQLLYFHLSMRADDEGFNNKPKSIMKMIGASEDDLKILFMKKFVIPFESGVVVVKHWKINNSIRKDMFHETTYKEERAQLIIDENDAYTLRVTKPLQDCNENVTQIRLDKNRLDKNKYILSDSEDENAKAKIVIDYLNQKTGKAYRYSETSLKHIRARLKDHFTVEDCKKVIDNKVTSWKGTKYEQYLRPETLFTGKFETYLNEKPIKNQKVLPQYMDDEFDITQTEEFKELERELNDDNAKNE